MHTLTSLAASFPAQNAVAASLRPNVDVNLSSAQWWRNIQWLHVETPLGEHFDGEREVLETEWVHAPLLDISDAVKHDAAPAQCSSETGCGCPGADRREKAHQKLILDGQAMMGSPPITWPPSQASAIALLTVAALWPTYT
jgi:hypothetical protein